MARIKVNGIELEERDEHGEEHPNRRDEVARARGLRGAQQADPEDEQGRREQVDERCAGAELHERSV